MKQVQLEYFADDQEASTAMDVDDDVDVLDFFGDGPIAGDHHHVRLADADFFNSFTDDFDDSDIN
ncbi:hypothetical protein LguiA_030447 [Lonicera macranthoides]